MKIIDSKISVDWINMWINTPKGYIYGYPDWGHNFYTLLFKNNNNLNMKLDIVMDKIRHDLGDEVAQFITKINLLSVDNEELYIEFIILDQYSIYIEVTQ